MSDAVETPERSDDELLLDVAVVGKYKIRPLSYGKFAEILPLCAELKPLVASAFPDGFRPDKGTLFTVVALLLPHLHPILACVVDADPEEIKALPAGEGIRLALAVWSQNTRLFLDFFTMCSSLAGK